VVVLGKEHKKCLGAQVTNQCDEILKEGFSSVSCGTFCQPGRFFMTRLGDIKSENAYINNEKSCGKHDRLPVEGFLLSVNPCRVNRSVYGISYLSRLVGGPNLTYGWTESGE
jgi:hypothetical protein